MQKSNADQRKLLAWLVCGPNQKLQQTKSLALTHLVVNGDARWKKQLMALGFHPGKSEHSH
jgi:hypothetical protein